MFHGESLRCRTYQIHALCTDWESEGTVYKSVRINLHIMVSHMTPEGLRTNHTAKWNIATTGMITSAQLIQCSL